MQLCAFFTIVGVQVLAAQRRKTETLTRTKVVLSKQLVESPSTPTGVVTVIRVIRVIRVV
jgi:hypothetical protein